MKVWVVCLLGFLTVCVSEVGLANCRASHFGDYEQYDFESMAQVRQFCDQHASNFGLIPVGKEYRPPVKVDHWGQIAQLEKAETFDASFDDYCFYVQRRTGGGWGRETYRYDARFYYRFGEVNGRGPWAIFSAFESEYYYQVYQGWAAQLRLHFDPSCNL